MRQYCYFYLPDSCMETNGNSKLCLVSILILTKMYLLNFIQENRLETDMLFFQKLLKNQTVRSSSKSATTGLFRRQLEAAVYCNFAIDFFKFCHESIFADCYCFYRFLETVLKLNLAIYCNTCSFDIYLEVGRSYQKIIRCHQIKVLIILLPLFYICLSFY